MDPRPDAGEWLTLMKLYYYNSPDRDFHPARYTKLKARRDNAYFGAGLG
jgi:hypothetical protein